MPMKYQLYSEDAKEESVHVVTLKLVQRHNQTHVCCVDPLGRVDYYLITFNTDGTVRMNGFLPKSLGFQLDDCQAIVVKT